MIPGPKPVPVNLRLLPPLSNTKAAPGALEEVRPPVEIPDCPGHLLPVAKSEWARITPVLADLGLISKMDRAALAVYCQAYGRWRQAERKIAEANAADPDGEAGLIGLTPSGYKQMSVWLQISNRAAEQMYKFLCEFGMTPSARSRVTPSDVQPFLPGFEPKDGAAPAAKNPGFGGL